MPSEDYTPVVRGGLKLKGGGGISKKKKKRSGTSSDDKDSAARQGERSFREAVAREEEDKPEVEERESALERGSKHEDGDAGEGAEAEAGAGEDLDAGADATKTASERAYEEMRKKRLKDRLEKEGVKTHKERVEGLNRYLSTLSEHHDLPRIGPG